MSINTNFTYHHLKFLSNYSSPCIPIGTSAEVKEINHSGIHLFIPMVFILVCNIIFSLSSSFSSSSSSSSSAAAAAAAAFPVTEKSLLSLM